MLPRIIVPIVTPRKEGIVDTTSLAKLLRFQINNHLSAIFILGTTGEFNKLSLTNKKILLDASHNIISLNKEKPVFLAVGISAKNITETLDLIEYCVQKKYHIDAFVIAPLFGEGNPEEKVKLTLQNTIKPVMLYNNPEIHDGLNIPIKLLESFLGHPQILGIKDSSGNRKYFDSLLLLSTPKFHIYQGATSYLADDLTNPKVTGIIAGIANVIPLTFYKLTKGIVAQTDLADLLTTKKQLAKYSNNIQGIKSMLYDKGVLDSAEVW